MDIFDFINYRRFLRDKIAKMPKRGRGVARQMAEVLNVHPTLVSQVLLDKKDFTVEQAQRLLSFLRLTDMQAQYFVLLVEFSRAGTKDLQDFKRLQIESLRKQNADLQNKIKQSQRIDEKHSAKYYSRWEYGAIRLLVSSNKYQTAAAIAERLNMSEHLVNELLLSLQDFGLIEIKNNKISSTSLSTYAGKGSPFRLQHARNWRRQAESTQTLQLETGIHFTAPVIVGKKEAEQFKNRLLALIEEFTTMVDNSPAEELHCFLMDWFEPGQGS